MGQNQSTKEADDELPIDASMLMEQSQHWCRLMLSLELCIKPLLLALARHKELGLPRDKEEFEKSVKSCKWKEENASVSLMQDYQLKTLETLLAEHGLANLDLETLIILMLQESNIVKKLKISANHFDYESTVTSIMSALNLKHELNITPFANITTGRYNVYKRKIEHVLECFKSDMVLYEKLTTEELGPFKQMAVKVLEERIEYLQSFQFKTVKQTRCKELIQETDCLFELITQNLRENIVENLKRDQQKQEQKQQQQQPQQQEQQEQEQEKQQQQQHQNHPQQGNQRGQQGEEQQRGQQDMQQQQQQQKHPQQGHQRGQQGEEQQRGQQDMQQQQQQQQQEQTQQNDAKEFNDRINLLRKQTYETYRLINTPSSSNGRSTLQITPMRKRDEIVVDLSVVIDRNSFYNLRSQSDIGRIQTQREKQKNLTKTQVNYDDVIISTNDYVVISGVPGSGKTTFIESLLYKWSIFELWNRDSEATEKDASDKKLIVFDFVFVFYFRKMVRFRNSTEMTWTKLLKHFYPSFEWSENAFLEDCKGQNKNVLFIFDGFDEFSNKMDFQRQPEEEWSASTRSVHDLLDPENPTFASVTRVVTSRPGCCSILMDTFFPHHSRFRCYLRIVEVCGFSEENIQRYINKHAQCKRTSGTIAEIVKANPILESLMSIPFYCWAICYLLNNSEEDTSANTEIPYTYTSLFANLLTLFVQMHSCSENRRINARDLMNRTSFRHMILSLSRLAYSLEKDGKITFKTTDISTAGDDTIKELIKSTGLLVQTDTSLSRETEYQFLHYSFHEFLVAIHLFHTGLDDHIQNPYILSMVSGLFGGLVVNSSSQFIVQKYATLFENMAQHIGTNLDIFSILDRAPIAYPESSFEYKSFDSMENKSFYLMVLYEYQNAIFIDRDFYVVSSNDNLNSYEMQCLQYLQKQQRKGSFRIKNLTMSSFRSFRDDNQSSAKLHVLFLSSTEGKTTVLFNSGEQVKKFADFIIKEGTNGRALKLSKLFFLTGPMDKVDKIIEVLPYVATIETYGTISQLVKIGSVIHQSKIKTGKCPDKLIFHCSSNQEFSLNDLICVHLHVLEEIEFGYKPSSQVLGIFDHRHSRSCITFEVWKRVFQMSIKIQQEFKSKPFQNLKSIQVGASCLHRYPLHNNDALFFHPDELENLNIQEAQPTDSVLRGIRFTYSSTN